MPTKKTTVNTYNNKVWVNKHENVVQKTKFLSDVWNPTDLSVKTLERFQSTIKALSTMLGNAVKDKVTLRAVGGGWSLSRAAVTNGGLINTKPLNEIISLSSKSVSNKYPGDYKNLFYVQCGASILEVNRFLRQKGKSLKTTGASNGQTIAGAISTGTHGSALNVGSMQDYVVGLHLIVGKSKHIILERESYPISKPSLAAKLGAELIRDDKLFNAALVSFGSFGIIHGIMIETEPLFLLELHRQRLPVDDKLFNAMDTLKFDNLGLEVKNKKPYHFEVVFNIHDLDNGAYVTTIYKKPYSDNYTPPDQTLGKFGPGDDMLAVVGTLSDAVPALVPTLVNALVGEFYSIPPKPITGVIGEIFSATETRGKALSTEMGLSYKDSSKSFKQIVEANKEVGPFAGIVAYRYVKQSGATLAFTKYDKTCTIEMQAVYSDRSKEFYDRAWQNLDDAGVQYTFHWGQVNNLTPQKTREKYGDAAVDEWLEARKTLLSSNVRSVFNSPFLKKCGLAN